MTRSTRSDESGAGHLAEPPGDPGPAEFFLVRGELERRWTERTALHALLGHERHLDARDLAAAELDVAGAVAVVRRDLAPVQHRQDLLRHDARRPLGIDARAGHRRVRDVAHRIHAV